MATIAAAGECWQVKLRSRLEEQEVLNVMHFISPAGDSDVLAHLLQALVNCFLLQLLPGMAAGFTLVDAVGHRVSPDVGPEIQFIPDQNQTVHGGVDGDSLPSYCSAVVSIHTVRGGRSGRGRIFIGGIPEGSTTASKITIPSAFWTALINYIACVVSHFITGDPPAANTWQLAVLSRKIGGVHEPYTANGFAAATGLIPHQQLGTTRSRKVGHGS